MKINNIKKTTAIFMLAILVFSVAGCGSLRMIVDNARAVNDAGIFTEPKSESDEPVKMMRDSDVVGEKTNSKLEKIEDIIDDNFYFDDEDQAKQDGIIKGYMEGLNDPYSVYYTAEEYSSFLEDTGGTYVGVGIQVSQNADTKVCTIVKVFDGPARKAGIEPNDIITTVNGEDISGQDIDTVVDKIRGEEGTDVSIGVYRSSDASEHEYTMKRRSVENPTVEYKMLADNIGYISVSSFYEVTGVQFIAAVNDLQAQGMAGLIVDMRDNGGGLLNIAVDMLDFMLPAGMLVYTEDKNGNVTSEYTSTDDEQFTKPLVLLVNGNSASAAEIFAGAIKDYGTGTLVGTTTFGKGIVQRLFPLDDGSAIKLTIAKYFTPNGNDIHKVGIEPDVNVELDVTAYRESKGEKDNQLDAAMDEILKKLGKAPKYSLGSNNRDDAESSEE